MNLARHGLVAALFCAIAGAGAAAADRVLAHSAAPGTAFVWAADASQVRRVLGGDVRVLRVMAGGRLLQLHVDSFSGDGFDDASVVVAWRVPMAFSLPGCG